MKTFEEALYALLSDVQITDKTETIHVADGLLRILAEDIVSSVNVPPHDNSQMDGYALHSYDLEHGNTFPVSQRIAAGEVGTELEHGTLARIFTGAPIPPGANQVVMQEDTEEIDGQIQVKIGVKPGENIRKKGEDIKAGEVILKAGTRLRPQELGLISSIGIGEIQVYQPLKIATFTTGDELLEPGDQPQEGKIYNANRYTLSGLIPQLGFELVDMGRVEDTLEATIDAMKQAAAVADVVMTTGGVSVGEEDHIKPALETLGELHMWKVKMKPGKPIAYGKIGMENGFVPFIGLPGNPVSAFATFKLFARPYLMKMQGATELSSRPIWLKADFDWPKANFRRDFLRARIVNKRQESVVEIFPHQGSGVLMSASWAEGFAVIPEDTTIAKGDKVAFYPFSTFV
ncbi:molybdopterin molybdotransferase MoeA [Thiomicrorhabdus heinhorstiae]|uniref:Molybdopterin molybdenumtransferase n=1 Tax=Thiomicrorhabdus heinhorstiae TaxID=2748010 RepID=A0ABS0C1W7_9GAMM|nr:gephyrin-like molybdotransferase Glp [Thiomicrorhabdus heinhorstiae]MBF6059091.1 molybdopterin molybdotransferase MoeA [Thiomicrorhabdus heinhorstiae]